jgi:predicted acyl esterase
MSTAARDTDRPSAYPVEWRVEFSTATPLPEGYRVGRETTPLRAGTVLIEGGKPLPCDVMWEQDIPITLRDGVVIYTDVLRPADQDTELPAIISWSSYGKSLPTQPPWGVPRENFSGLAKFEGADGAFWLKDGYALVNPDIRGAGKSGGDIQYWGSVDSHDGYDVVEWAAQQSWSNGKVALYGASWLAISQWGIAATKPPHLAAIAPWNGMYDVYRTHMVWGGIPDPGFFDFIPFMVPGDNSAIEQIGTMARREQLLNAYWEDKTPDLSDLSVPAYVVVDGVTGLHSMGGPEAFRRLGSTEKWMRINNTQEWNDQYTGHYQQDVLRFFDRYLKDIDNGWEDTARVRACVINAGGEDFVDLPYSDWPLAETTYRRLYLEAGAGELLTAPPAQESSTTYPGVNGSTEFTITVEEAMTLVGYMSVRLWVEAQDADDMDLFVLVEKLDAEGHLLAPHREHADTYPVSPPGAPGRLRVSLRELDPTLSTDFLPVHAFRRHQQLSSGEIVPVDIGLTPRAYHVEAGQQLRLTVAGWNVRGTGVDVESTEDGPLRAGRVSALTPLADNRGNHVIHTGPEHLSYLTVPVVDNPR